MNATVSELERTRGAGRASVLPVASWAILLAALTVGSAVWLASTGGDYRDFSPVILVVAYSPAIAAIVVASFQRGMYGVRALLAQLARWRARPWLYAIAFLGPFALALGTVGIVTMGGGTPPPAPLVVPSAATALALLGPMLAGSLGEELGWRGFAQARLQTRRGALLAAIAVGVIWSTWHLWPVLTPQGSAVLGPVDVAQTFLRLVATAIVYAWLYNASGRSLPVVLVAHAGHNLAVDLMPVAVIGTNLGAWILAGLYALAAIAVVFATHGRLGSTAGGERR
jgi:membrane protease YdiL (CAAX protease family)